MTAIETPRRGLVLATLCLCAFAVNLDVTLVNVTLPTLVVDLQDASTRELQWIVDSYTLTFAALVLAAGSLGDRFGRRKTLMVGLVVYGVGNGLAALTSSTDALIATRALMGVGAAIIFPTTLSIITNVFTERGERARAIGLWGASHRNRHRARADRRRRPARVVFLARHLPGQGAGRDPRDLAGRLGGAGFAGPGSAPARFRRTRPFHRHDRRWSSTP